MSMPRTSRAEVLHVTTGCDIGPGEVAGVGATDGGDH